MNKVQLFYSKSPGLEVAVIARLENEDLIIDGYDAGGIVKKLTGDFDYEYSIRVTAKNLSTLQKELNLTYNNKQELLTTIANIFSGEKCFSNFTAFLDTKGIPYESFFN